MERPRTLNSSYLLTYLLTYLLIYLLTYLHTYLFTYLLTYLHTYLLTYLFTYLLTYLHTYLLTLWRECCINVTQFRIDKDFNPSFTCTLTRVIMKQKQTIHTLNQFLRSSLGRRVPLLDNS